jgi:hypothetical protein
MISNFENQILPYSEGENREAGSEVSFNQLATHLSEYDYKQRRILRYTVIYTSFIVVYGTKTYGRDSGDK